MLRIGEYDGHCKLHKKHPYSRFFFAFLCLTRYSFRIGLVDRPLCVGFLWGLLMGDMQTALFLAVFYELFWLDLFPAGTYLPPNPLFPMLCLFSLLGSLQDISASHLFFPIMITLPLAFFGSFLEKTHRKWQLASYNQLIRSFRKGNDLGASAAKSIRLALVQLFSLNFVVFVVTAYLLWLGSESLQSIQGHPLHIPHASWPLLWGFGAVGGLMALRIRQSYVLFIAGSVALCVYALCFR
ncbi:hypothetical protein FACS1894206_06840 [Deltaproteobacteria bacterium]|nr:hypothetical protein FACS1894206_06840 [Deltaproteobacteria bacterium]